MLREPERHMSSRISIPDDLDPLEEALIDGIGSLPTSARPWPQGPLDPFQAATLFEAQVTSRLLDHTARWLRSRGHGYYTISSAGHESDAAIALALRPTDPALLHYRSGAFLVARAAQVDGVDPVTEILRGMLASSSEAIAGGRHKVLGHPQLSIIPLTSTISSHLPRAVGLAQTLRRAEGLGALTAFPTDAIVVCSFGDASLNHSTAQGAINWASHLAQRDVPAPVLFVCEDNGIGISVPTPAKWVAESMSDRPNLAYRYADGRDPAGVMATTRELAAEIRATGRPGFLHLETVRFLGHAGSDVESAYRTADAIRRDQADDPILATAALLVTDPDHGPGDLIDWYVHERALIRQRAIELLDEHELQTAEEVMAPLAPLRPDHIAVRGAGLAGAPDPTPLTFAQTVNRALDDVLAKVPQAIIFGEDVGAKGGVYGVTRGLQRMHGQHRVFDTLLDESSILGLALGAGVAGCFPIAEIQYLAYVHNAIDQIRGEAASMSFFSNGQFRNPMLVRIAAYAYQKGFGGHFHNDNAVAALRDIPGLIIASPGHPRDAGPMLKTCVAAGLTDGAVSVYLEPIARYHTQDVHDDGDGLWMAPYEQETTTTAIGTARVHGDGTGLTIVSWANGLFLSLRAARRLAALGIAARVVDLRWLAPLPIQDVLDAGAVTGRVLIADETRASGGVSEGIITGLVDRGYTGTIRRVTARDSFIPLGDAARHVLLDEDDIVAAARSMVTDG